MVGLILLMLAVMVSGSSSGQQLVRATKPALSNKFIGVTSQCSQGSVRVEVRTEEAFYGSVYARGYPTRCGVMGGGNTTTSLLVPSQKCGVKVIEDQSGHHTYEVVIYIQFDKWVQQVIDEQVHVRCSPEREAGELHAAAQMSVVNKEVSVTGRSDDNNDDDEEDDDDRDDNTIAAIVVAARPPGKNRHPSSSSQALNNGVPSKLTRLVSLRHKSSSSSPSSSSSAALRGRAQDDILKDWKPMNTPPDLMLWQSQRPEGNSEPVSCWMDIVAGRSMDGRPVLDFLLVGDDTTMVLKVRQQPGLDTRITACVAHDGSGDQSQELIDENGCSVDDDIMPPLRVKFNPRTGVKVAYASFKAFKFPDRDNLHLRCTVLVCLGSCHLPVCGRTSNRLGRKLGQGSVQPILDLQDLHQPSSSSSQGGRGNDRALASRVLDRVEVFNSVEVRAPGIESRPDLVKQYRVDRNKVESVDFFSDENMFCVTPYKMILAFGVLLTILLVALLFALYSCVRARVMKARLLKPPPGPQQHPSPYHHPAEAHRHSPVAAPYYRFPH